MPVCSTAKSKWNATLGQTSLLQFLKFELKKKLEFGNTKENMAEQRISVVCTDELCPGDIDVSVHFMSNLIKRNETYKEFVRNSRMSFQIK